MTQTPEEIRQDDQIECTECGHTLEQFHRIGGCEFNGCTCRLRWTVEQIRDLRASYGLTKTWRRRYARD